MPKNSSCWLCFDYPYTMKLTYPHDLKLLEVLYDEFVLTPEKDKTIQVVNNYLSAEGKNKDISNWILNVQRIMQEIVSPKYELTYYVMNSQTEANIVYEAESKKYGSIIVKFSPSYFFFHKEYTYYSLADSKIMADLIDFDSDYNFLVIKSLKPGIRVKFDTENIKLRKFYDYIDEHMIPASALRGDKTIPTIMQEFEEYVIAADKFTFEYDFRKAMEKKARKVYNTYFGDSPQFFLHRDLHRRNILVDGDTIRAIDPRGAIGPKEFEYVIQFVIEIREKQEYTLELFDVMLNYFCKYVDKEKLLAALFFFFVYKMNDYVFQKKDNYALASWLKKSIETIFFDNGDELINTDVMPKQLRWLQND